MKNLIKNEKGFTLIELMIVIAILGILAAVAIPNFLNARGKAQDASALSTLEALKTAMEMYAADNGSYNTTGVAITTVAGLRTMLGENWPSNIDSTASGLTGSLANVTNIVNATGTSYSLWSIGRDSTHAYSLRETGTKTGPSAVGSGI